jgi:hypothetical protein
MSSNRFFAPVLPSAVPCSVISFFSLCRIVDYIATKHFPAGTTVTAWAGCLDGLTREVGVSPEEKAAGEKMLAVAAEKLSKWLRELPNLTLKVTHSTLLSSSSTSDSG